MSEEPRFCALRITPRAAADIDAAHARFVELTDEKIVDDWKAGLLEAIAPLAFMPHRQLAPEQARFQQEIRRILHIRHEAARSITRAEAKEREAGA